MLKSLSNKYLVQTGTQKEKKNRDTETKKIFEVVSELLDWIGSFGHHIKRVLEIFILAKSKMLGMLLDPFWVLNTISQVLMTQNVRVGSHRGPEYAFWVKFAHFGHFLVTMPILKCW